MEISVFESQEEASKAAAEVMAAMLQKKPDSILCLPTGSTPLPMYRELVRLHVAGRVNFASVTTFNLDEYVDIPPTHPQSFHHYMRENFFAHINIAAENIHIPDGLTKNIPAFCNRYEARICDAGGIDIQVLGIGLNGHIGFNEPGSSHSSRTRLVTLTSKTRADNARFFDTEESVPWQAITMGIANIMEARECILMVFGNSKARILAEALYGPVTEANPASILQTHPSLRLFADQQAAQYIA